MEADNKRLKLLREVFGKKVYMEFEQYRSQMLREEPKEIFNNAYQIDCHITMYEYLLSIGEQLSENEMMVVIGFSDFLEFLYGEWLKTDLGEEDLYQYIQDVIRNKTKSEYKEVA